MAPLRSPMTMTLTASPMSPQNPSGTTTNKWKNISFQNYQLMRGRKQPSPSLPHKKYKIQRPLKQQTKRNDQQSFTNILILKNIQKSSQGYETRAQMTSHSFYQHEESFSPFSPIRKNRNVFNNKVH
jgi:hypothetical protein